MGLPAINFTQIAQTAKDALSVYGTPVEFFEQGSSAGRTIRAVIYRDGATNNVLQFVQDADTMLATAILNPDDFASPHRMPQKFDSIKVSVGGLTRSYTIDSVSPILASNTLPLILVNIKAN